MKKRLSLPLLFAVFLTAACNGKPDGSTTTNSDTVKSETPAESSGMNADDTVRRSDASRPAPVTDSAKRIGKPEEKIKNLK